MDWLERAYQCRTTENEIRHWLDTHGYQSKSAQFDELELHASQANGTASGQVRVFRFTIQAAQQAVPAVADSQRTLTLNDSPLASTSDTEWTPLFGACRSDQDHRTEIAVYGDKEKRDQLLGQWSQGLTRRKSGTPCRAHCAMDLVWFAGALMGVMILLAFLLQ